MNRQRYVAVGWRARVRYTVGLKQACFSNHAKGVAKLKNFAIGKIRDVIFMFSEMRPMVQQKLLTAITLEHRIATNISEGEQTNVHS